MKTRRIFVSLPADSWLSDQENETKWAIVKAVEDLGYQTEVFLDPRGRSSLAASQAWSASACDQVMRRCEGCMLLGFARWRFTSQTGSRWRFTHKSEPVRLPTEYNHYEGAVARTVGLPLLVLVQADVLRRVVFDANYRGYVGVIPPKPSLAWLSDQEFLVPFKYWRDDLERRRDVFLGYCGSSCDTAGRVRAFLEDECGIRVLDWKRDFDPATSILHQIEEASRRCGAGIFLFTMDDQLLPSDGEDRAIPRDNVVFEAGYFSALKGKSRVLIVRESGTKLPADLGGDIYASLENREEIAQIKPVLGKFLETL